MPSPTTAHPDDPLGEPTQAFLTAAAGIDHAFRLDRLPDLARQLVPALDPRAAMVALLDVRQALHMAGCYEQGSPDTLPAVLACLNVPGPRAGQDAGRWQRRQAEAWRELAWAIARDTVEEARLAQAVAR